MKQKIIRINQDELEQFIKNCCSILPKIWNILMLNLEIVNRQLEPIKSFIEANESISKNENEVIENMTKNCNFSNDKLKYFLEILKNQHAIKKDLFELKLLLDFLQKNKILETKLEANRKLDDIETNIPWVQDLQKKDLKS